MNTPSLIVAALLQVLPLTRAAVPLVQGSSNVIAIVIRWAGAMTAALGGVHAVAGASTFITSSMKPTAKQGQSFSLRLTTAPDPAHFWTATGLPASIKLVGTSGSTSWRLEGTPTVAGTFNVLITAKDKASSGSDRTVSGTMVLTVTASGTAPTITTSPQDLTLLSGGEGSLSVVASGSAPLGYRWRRNGATVTVGTNATLTLAQASAGTAGNYDVVVTNGVGSVTSQVAVVTVILPPVIVTPPQPLTLAAGGSGLLSVVAESSVPASYAWRRDGESLTGETNATLELTAFSAGWAGDYDVVVSNPAGAVTSQVARVTLRVDVPLIIEVTASSTGSASVLSFKAQPGHSYYVEATDDLAAQAWVRIQDIAAGTELTTQIIQDPDAGRHAHRFYRVVAP